MLCGAVHDFFVVPKNVFPDPEWCLGMLSASVTVNEWIVGGPFLNLARSKDGEPRNKYVAGGGGVFTHSMGYLWKLEDKTEELVISFYFSIGSRDQTQVIWRVRQELSLLCHPVSPGLA